MDKWFKSKNSPYTKDEMTALCKKAMDQKKIKFKTEDSGALVAVFEGKEDVSIRTILIQDDNDQKTICFAFPEDQSKTKVSNTSELQKVCKDLSAKAKGSWYIQADTILVYGHHIKHTQPRKSESDVIKEIAELQIHVFTEYVSRLDVFKNFFEGEKPSTIDLLISVRIILELMGIRVEGMGERQLVARCSQQNLEWTLRVVFVSPNNHMFLFGELDKAVRKEHIGKVAMFLAKFNYNKRLGWIDLEPESGKIRAVTTLTGAGLLKPEVLVTEFLPHLLAINFALVMEAEDKMKQLSPSQPVLPAPAPQVSKELEQCVQAGKCTLTVTGKSHQYQKWRTCVDCFGNTRFGACEACIKVCHAGHRLGEVQATQFYCDCGEGTGKKVRCMCLAPSTPSFSIKTPVSPSESVSTDRSSIATPKPSPSPSDYDWIPSESIEYDEKTELIGQGGMGKVFKGKMDGHEVAIKSVLISKKESKQLHDEISNHSNLNHPCVVRMYGVSKKGTETLLVMELCKNKSLRDVLDEQEEVISDWNIRKTVALDICSGMNYLHNRSRPILHMDLKPQNIMIGEDLRAKVGDFGVSMTMTVTRRTMAATQPPKGFTAIYCAPEVFNGESYTFSADVYSFSMILYTLLTLKEPFENFSALPSDVLTHRIYKEGIRPKTDGLGLSNAHVDLLTSMWDANPKKRPTFQACHESIKNW